MRKCCAGPATTVWPYIFHRTIPIFGLEIRALALFLDDWALSLWGSFCWVYLGNNSFLSAWRLGDSNAEVIDVMAVRR